MKIRSVRTAWSSVPPRPVSPSRSCSTAPRLRVIAAAALAGTVLLATGCSALSEDDLLEVRAGTGGFAFAEPRKPKDSWWASFSFPLCARSAPVRIVSADVDEVHTPVKVQYRLMTYDAVRVREGQSVTRGGTLRGRPRTVDVGGRDHIGWPGFAWDEYVVPGTVEPLEGATVRHSCTSPPEPGGAEHFVVVSARVDDAGTWLEDLRFTYEVDGEERTTVATEWQMIACGDAVRADPDRDRDICQR